MRSTPYRAAPKRLRAGKKENQGESEKQKRKGEQQGRGAQAEKGTQAEKRQSRKESRRCAGARPGKAWAKSRKRRAANTRSLNGEQNVKELWRRITKYETQELLAVFLFCGGKKDRSSKAEETLN